MTDPRIEAVARLLCEQDRKNPDAISHAGYRHWEVYLPEARRTTAAFDVLMKEREKP